MLIKVIYFSGCIATVIGNPINCKPFSIRIDHQLLRSKLYFNGTRTRTGRLQGRYFVYINIYMLQYNSIIIFSTIVIGVLQLVKSITINTRKRLENAK